MNTPIYSMRPRSQSVIPDVIFILLIANGLVFALQQFSGNFMMAYFALWPVDAPYFWPWQLLTYGFMHSPNVLTHILFNMLMLWMFGRELERMMGPKRFLTYYLTCVVGAGIVQLIVAGFQGSFHPTVGASGAFPNRMIMLMFPPIPMKAKYMVILFGLLELYMGISGGAPGVANFAHLGGMLFGFVLLRHWTKPRRRG